MSRCQSCNLILMPLSSFDGPQIRLVLNEDTYSLLSCAKTTQDHKYGACSLEAFVKANEFSTSISFGGDTWEFQAVCGHPHLEGLYVQEEFLGNFVAQTPKHAHGVCLLYFKSSECSTCKLDVGAGPCCSTTGVENGIFFHVECENSDF